MAAILNGNLVRAFHGLSTHYPFGQEVVLFAKLALGPSKSLIQPASASLSVSGAQSRHLVEVGRFNNDY